MLSPLKPKHQKKHWYSLAKYGLNFIFVGCLLFLALMFSDSCISYAKIFVLKYAPTYVQNCIVSTLGISGLVIVLEKLIFIGL